MRSQHTNLAVQQGGDLKYLNPVIVQGMSSRDFAQALGWFGSPEIAHRDNIGLVALQNTPHRPGGSGSLDDLVTSSSVVPPEDAANGSAPGVGAEVTAAVAEAKAPPAAQGVAMAPASSAGSRLRPAGMDMAQAPGLDISAAARQPAAAVSSTAAAGGPSVGAPARQQQQQQRWHAGVPGAGEASAAQPGSSAGSASQPRLADGSRCISEGSNIARLQWHGVRLQDKYHNWVD